MMKRVALLAVSAIAAIAFAVPAVASAQEWLHNGSPLTENETVEFTGHAAFTGGVTCDPVVAHVILKPGNMGTVTSFGPEGNVTEVCKTTGTLAALGCTIHTVTPENLPWTVDVNATNFTITGVKIKNGFSNCVFPTVTIQGDVTATPDNASSISSVALSGTLNSELGEVGVEGSLGASPAGTYGIG